jgi:hypothetical protein
MKDLLAAVNVKKLAPAPRVNSGTASGISNAIRVLT